MRIRLFLADHFDTLANGKVVAVGLFPDGVVVMNVPADMPEPTVDMPFGLDLGLLLTLSDITLEGADAEVSIHPPRGLPAVGGVRVSGLRVGAGLSANILTKLQPLIIPCPGIYEVRLQVGDHVMTDCFEVRIARQPAAPAAAALAAPVPAAKAARARAKKAL